jgi:hypothetical protein
MVYLVLRIYIVTQKRVRIHYDIVHRLWPNPVGTAEPYWLEKSRGLSDYDVNLLEFLL